MDYNTPNGVPVASLQSCESGKTGMAVKNSTSSVFLLLVYGTNARIQCKFKPTVLVQTSFRKHFCFRGSGYYFLSTNSTSLRFLTHSLRMAGFEVGAHLLFVLYMQSSEFTMMRCRTLRYAHVHLA